MITPENGEAAYCGCTGGRVPFPEDADEQTCVCPANQIWDDGLEQCICPGTYFPIAGDDDWCYCPDRFKRFDEICILDCPIAPMFTERYVDDSGTEMCICPRGSILTFNETSEEWYCPIITVPPEECPETRYAIVLDDTYLEEKWDCLCLGDLIEDMADPDGTCVCPATQFPARGDPTTCVCRDTEIMLDDGFCGCKDFQDWIDIIDED
mgnify:CR=1 FL=1